MVVVNLKKILYLIQYIFMKRNLLHFEFPKGVQSFCVNGVSYTQESFLLAQKKERFRSQNGRFVKKSNF